MFKNKVNANIIFIQFLIKNLKQIFLVTYLIALFLKIIHLNKYFRV